jgi:hypothetical protein
MLTTLTTDDELTKLAKQAGFNLEFDDYVYEHWNSFQAFAKLVDAKATEREREACAKVCEEIEVEETHYCMNVYEEGTRYKFAVIEAIRARSQQ